MTTNKSGFNSFSASSSCEVIAELHRDDKIVVYRAWQQAWAVGQEPRLVVIKVLLAEYPTNQDLLKFRHQYAIAKNLNLSGVVRSYGLVEYGRGYALVMEDFGGVSLDKYLQNQHLSIPDILAIAIQLASTLQALGYQQIVHKDIKPANIVIHPVTKQVKLIDFGVASLLSNETQGIVNPKLLAGTLAYLSPEQTGRMNRGMDYRTDFYALGVTLYELLTRVLPFKADDPIDLIYCHLAKLAIPANQVNPAIPVMVAQIVAKLMAKNAEDRYQSAGGLQFDLEKCLDQWQATGTIAAFLLGERDSIDRFSIPEKLYGREMEVQTLLDAFHRVSEGRTEMMLVAGTSGIGKTAVIKEIHKPITCQRSYFVQGKYDQFNRDIPLSAIIQALRDLMKQLRNESDKQIAIWKSRILAAVAENGQILIDVIPELDQIIGSQLPVANLSGKAAEQRFYGVFQKFMAVFSTAEHPLIIFLDDLQWVNEASLQLLELLLENNKYLLVLGAYRDNEVSSTHPLLLAVDQWQQSTVTINTITIRPLGWEDIDQLVADTLHCSTTRARPLTELIDRRTHGNPFFITQFLKTLHADGEIVVKKKGYWECDLSRLQSLAWSDNIIEFMTAQLQKLPSDTQQLLMLAACIGNQFGLDSLAIISAQSSIATSMALWPALQAGLILPNSQMYQLEPVETSPQQNDDLHFNLTYRFLHDRVQQAAYCLISDNQRQTTHLRIGRLLLAHNPEPQQSEQLFEIVNHFNIAVVLLTNSAERDVLAQLNLRAAQKAKAATAYGVAFRYAQIGAELLGDEGWGRQYPMALALHETMVVAAFLNGDFTIVPTWAQVVLDRAQQPLDRVKVYQTIIQFHTIQKQYEQSINSGIAILQEFGIKLAAQPHKLTLIQALATTKIALWGKSDASLLALPVITSPEHLAVIEILDLLMIPAFYYCQELMVILATMGIKLTLQQGNSPGAADFYGSYGAILASLGALEQSYRFGQLAISLVDRFTDVSITARVKATVPWFSQLFKEPLRSNITLVDESVIAALDSGNLTFLGVGAYLSMLMRFYAGVSLAEITDKLPELEQVIRQSKDESSWESFMMHRQTVINLQENSATPYNLVGSDQEELVLVTEWQKKSDFVALSAIYTLKNFLAYLREDFSAALHYADAQLPYESTKTGMAQASIFDSLTRLAAYAQSDARTQKQLLRRVNHNQQLLWQRAQLMPGNFQHKYDLVAAEKCRVLADYTTAMELYDRSIAGAKANGYQQEEALANEVAAKFYLAWQKEKIATTYLKEAYYCYQRWGATAKTNDLEQRYAQFLTPILPAPSLPFNPLSTLSTITHSITNQIVDGKKLPAGDLGAAIQAAQLLSSIIEFPTLINQLCQILLKSSGAQICIPILLSNNKTSSQDGWQVYQIDTTTVADELIGVPLEEYHDLPLRLINQVRHSRQTIILSGRNVDSSLLADEYFQRYQPQSMMCLPLLYRDELQGIVYLENRHAADIFTSDRQIIVEFLAAQAVITLHNSQLYESVSQRSAAMEASLDGMAIIEKNGRLIYINRSYAQMYGYRVDELIGQHWSYLHDPDSMKEFENGACAIVAKSGQWRGEAIAIRKDGSTFYREVTLSLLANGQLISICRDITKQQSAESERQRIAAQLAASQQQCYNLIQSINGVVWEYDLKTDQFIFVSDRAESLFGYPLTDWLAKTNFWQSIVYPEDLDLVVSLYNGAIANRCNCEFEYRLVAADGQVLWVYDVSTLIFDDDGQAISSNGLLINISDIKQVEAALHDANERLELTNAELQRATRLKDEFLATMSHELRTPMNAILGMSEMLQEEILGPLNSRQLNSISTIEKSGEHLLSLINDILDVSKISAGKLGLNIEKTSLTQLCEASLLFVKQKAFEKQIQINIHLPANLESIWVDDRRMRQVLINLFTNAVKFTPNGGHVALTVSLQSPLVDKDGYNLCFAVTDTGIGIKHDDVAKLFQPFIQIDSSLNRQYEGTGLGLMLVKQIVELHGGRVSIESEVGKGSCFSLVIPQQHQVAEQESLLAVPPVISVDEMFSDSKIPLILLAEDNEMNIDTFASYLIGKGYRVIFAYNGQEAIEQAQKEHPDLILMDIQMPGMDGLEAIQRIRQQSTLANIPIIALTALAMPGDREKCLAAGADRYFAKPIKLQKLHQTIQKLLR